MGEFKVLLICGDDEPMVKTEARFKFLRAVEREFAGYTISQPLLGVWKDDSGKPVQDSVVACYIATDDSGKLTRLVSQYRDDAGEQCVYLRHPNGLVTLV